MPGLEPRRKREATVAIGTGPAGVERLLQTGTA